MEPRSKGGWTKEEDDTLVELVHLFGDTKWKEIWTTFHTQHPGSCKTYNQCRERWFNSLNPSNIRGRISEDERKAIFRLHQKYANKWNLISRELSGRSDNTIKTFFYSEIRKALKQYNRANPKNRIIRSPRALARDPQASVILNLCESSQKRPLPPPPPPDLFPQTGASWDTLFMFITGRTGLPR